MKLKEVKDNIGGLVILFLMVSIVFVLPITTILGTIYKDYKQNELMWEHGYCLKNNNYVKDNK